jgi:hypothetical protein
MMREAFQDVMRKTFAKCAEILTVKAGEYSSLMDRLHNFKQAAFFQQTTPESALSGMMAKHIVSIYDFIADLDIGRYRPLSQWDEKIIDTINYLVLLRALIVEREDREGKTEESEGR